MERFEVSNRLSGSPRDLFGSMDGNTCPDVLELTGGGVAIIGEIAETTEQNEPRIVVPLEVGVTALASMLHRT